MADNVCRDEICTSLFVRNVRINKTIGDCYVLQFIT